MHKIIMNGLCMISDAQDDYGWLWMIMEATSGPQGYPDAQMVHSNFRIYQVIRSIF
jgi:hypothetical protein